MISTLQTHPISLGLYFESENIWDKERRPISWDLWNPKNYIEIKLNGNFPNANLFISTHLFSNSQNKEIFFNQGHLQLKFKNSELCFFSRQDRFFLDSPLLFLVNSERVKDDLWGPKAEGMRWDIFDFYGFYSSLILSKFRSFDGEATLYQLRRKIHQDNYIGVIYTKKEWRSSNSPNYNEVLGLQSQIKLLNFPYIRAELAKSTHPHRIDPNSKENYAYEVELRPLRFSNFLLAMSHFNYGINFVNELSNKFNLLFDHQFSQKGNYLEIVYLFPYKTINLIFKLRDFKTRYQHPTVTSHPFRTRWAYAEVYTEFVAGVSSKLFFESYRDLLGTWNHAFIEFVGENTRMRIKGQYKIKDIGVNKRGREIIYSMGERHISGLELKINLTDYLTLYSRFAYGVGVSQSWETMFLQLAIRKFTNNEIFIEYGDPGPTDNDLVNDFDVSENPNLRTRDRIKFLVKFWL